MQELIATGSSVDEAVENALAQLGLTRDEIEYEVIDMPQKKLFGTTPARVIVKPLVERSVPEPEPTPPPAPEEPAPRRERMFSSSAPVTEEPEEPEEYDADSYASEDTPENELTEEQLSAPALASLTYFRDIVQAMGATDLTYRFYSTRRGVKFSIDGPDSAVIIGRRGETMESLQYLCMLVSSRTPGDYCKIIIDVASYRAKREKTLQSLAVREAAKVKKSQYKQVLEPMNPYERRIVHSAVQKIEGVKSESVGNEPYRRVVISLISGGKTRPPKGQGQDRDKGSSERPPQGSSERQQSAGSSSSGGGRRRDRDRGRGGRSGGSRRDRPPREYKPRDYGPIEEQPEGVPEKFEVNGNKLYGKIEF